MDEIEGLPVDPVSRRVFLKRSAVATGAVAATAMGGSLLTGCGSTAEEAPTEVAAAAAGDASSGEEEEYVVVGALLSIAYWEDPIAGMQQAEKELGVKVSFIGPDSWDAAQQVSQFQQALVRQPKGVAILPVDPKSVEPIIDEAHSKGIPVVTADSDAPTSSRLSFLGTDRYQAGVQSADAMAQALGGSGKIGVITLGGSIALEESLLGFRERLAEIAPGVEIVTQADSQGNPEIITDAVLTMIQGTPDLAGIFANGTQESSSTAAAVSQAGKGGELVVVGHGATLRTTDVMQAVADGVVTASVTQRGFQMFYYAIQFLYDLVHRKSSNFGLSWAETGISPLPPRVDTGTMIITPDNVQSFMDKLNQAQG